jgi:hypothetical protein
VLLGKDCATLCMIPLASVGETWGLGSRLHPGVGGSVLYCRGRESTGGVRGRIREDVREVYGDGL